MLSRHQLITAHHMRTQRGAVLIVAMIMLLVLTLLGITAMGTASLEERMANSEQESARAVQSAESVLSLAYDDAEAGTAAIGTNATVIYSQTTSPLTTLSDLTYAPAGLYSMRYMTEAGCPIGDLSTLNNSTITNAANDTVSKSEGQDEAGRTCVYYEIHATAYSKVAISGGTVNLVDTNPKDGYPDASSSILNGSTESTLVGGTYHRIAGSN